MAPAKRPLKTQHRGTELLTRAAESKMPVDEGTYDHDSEVMVLREDGIL